MGGGPLETVTFSIASDSFAGDVITDADVLLAVDDGNGSYGAEDTVVYDTTLTGLLAPGPGQFGQVRFDLITLDVAADNVVIPADALVWAGVTFASGGVKQVLFSPPSVGSPDQYVYVPGEGAFDTLDDGFPPDTGAGWELTVVPEPATGVLAVLAVLAIRRR